MSEHARQLIDQAHLPSNISPYSNPIPALDSPKHHPFFFSDGSLNIELLTLECHGLSEKPHEKRRGIAVVSFPFFFRWRLGPMNLVPSVKPGARGAQWEWDDGGGGFFHQRGFFPPNPIIFPGFLGFTRNSWRDWGSGARWQTGPLWNICPGATWQQIFCTEPGVAAILAGLHFGEHGPRMFKEVSSWKVPVELNHCRFQLVAAMHSRCSWHQEHGRLGKFPIGRPWP